jgi:hypothetical protein
VLDCWQPWAVGRRTCKRLTLRIRPERQLPSVEQRSGRCRFLRDDQVMGISARKKLPIVLPFASLPTRMLIALTAGTLRARCPFFTADTEFLVYMDSRNAVPTQEIRGRDGLRPVFENLSTYEATTHFNGQSTVTWAQDSATGVSYCLAHHVKVDGSRRNLMIASIRYSDHFVKMDGHWYFQQRKLMVDWIDNRPLGAS